MRYTLHNDKIGTLDKQFLHFWIVEMHKLRKKNLKEFYRKFIFQEKDISPSRRFARYRVKPNHLTS